MGSSLSHIELPTVKRLSDEETRHLLERVKAGDGAARSRLMEHNLRLVMSVVQRFVNRGEAEDLFQIGCIGLAKAIDGFDTTYQVRFSTYAVPVIIGEIKRHLRDDRTIRVSRSLKELAQRAMQKRSELEQVLDHTPTIKEVAAALEVEPEELVASMEAVRNPASLQSVIYEDEGQPVLLQDQIGVPAATDGQIDSLALRQVYETLKPEEQNFIRLRFFEEKTQMEVAEALQVSQAHISRLEKRILTVLRTKLSAQ